MFIYRKQLLKIIINLHLQVGIRKAKLCEGGSSNEFSKYVFWRGNGFWCECNDSVNPVE